MRLFQVIDRALREWGELIAVVFILCLIIVGRAMAEEPEPAGPAGPNQQFRQAILDLLPGDELRRDYDLFGTGDVNVGRSMAGVSVWFARPEVKFTLDGRNVILRRCRVNGVDHQCGPASAEEVSIVLRCLWHIRAWHPDFINSGVMYMEQQPVDLWQWADRANCDVSRHDYPPGVYQEPDPRSVDW